MKSPSNKPTKSTVLNQYNKQVKTTNLVRQASFASKCYVEENHKQIDTFVLESHKLLKSLLARVKKFIGFLDSGVSSATLTLGCIEEVQKLRDSTRYKYASGRNMLGVRVLLEDWIHGLEIGHVM